MTTPPSNFRYKVDKSIEVCETKDFPDELLLHAQTQAPSLSFPGEVVAALSPQAEGLLPGLRALAVLAAAERSAQEQREYEAIQEHLAMMGNCPMGYEWIKGSTGEGWHCAGGTHFVPDGDLSHIYQEYHRSDY